jgi:hypothetical protein
MTVSFQNLSNLLFINRPAIQRCRVILGITDVCKQAIKNLYIFLIIIISQHNILESKYCHVY